MLADHRRAPFAMRLTGWTSPFSRVFILKDGVAQISVQSGADGRFDNTLGSLERGSYTFATYAIDSKNRRTATQSSALTLSAGSNNAISEIMIPPTIELEKSSIGVGEGLVVFGEAVPGSVVEVYINPSRSTAPADLQKFSTTSPKGIAGIPDGNWSIPIDAGKLSKGTYSVRARTIRTTLSQSDFTRPLPLGVGETAPTDAGNRSDINKDGKVNLVDFSILLSNWGTKDEDSDINEDGAINLADFSIMLFNWTG